jgi:hypothetical protein
MTTTYNALGGMIKEPEIYSWFAPQYNRFASLCTRTEMWEYAKVCARDSSLSPWYRYYLTRLGYLNEQSAN